MSLQFGPKLTDLNISDQIKITVIEGLGLILVFTIFVPIEEIYANETLDFCIKINMYHLRNYDFSLVTIKKISTK